MTKPKYVIDPHNGVGPFRFGMSRSAIEPIIGKPSRTIDRRSEQGELIDYFPDQGVQVLYEPDGERVAAIQFTKSGVGEVLYPPDVRMDRTYDEIVQWVREQDPGPQRADGDYFRSDALGIAGGSRSDKEEEPGLDHLLVYRPRYYDAAKSPTGDDR
jgi:hypothetical protein